MRPEFIHSLSQLKAHPLPCVATIGSFDGVHRGHQHVLAQVKEKAKELGLPIMVMLFEPQPYEFFSGEKAPARIMRLRAKAKALFEQGVDRVVCLKFSQAFRSLTAEQYIKTVLADSAKVRYLVIGDDFRFGKNREGDFNLLQKLAPSFGFQVSDSLTKTSEGERISSTRIRELLEHDELIPAAELLGKPFQVLGRVTYGKQLGRKLGFPTLNIGLGRYRSPVRGVYIVNTHVAGRGVFPSVANVGIRPSVDGAKKPILEVHMLDQKMDLYGQFVEIEFVSKIRDEQHFDSIEQLRQQIDKDVDVAKVHFGI